MTTNNIQILSSKQVFALLNQIMEGTINLTRQLEDRYKEIRKGKEYIERVEKYKQTDEYEKKRKDEYKELDKKLALSELLQEIQKLESRIRTIKGPEGTYFSYSIISKESEELLRMWIEDRLRGTVETKIDKQLDIEASYVAHNKLTHKIKAMLFLTAIDTYENIIEKIMNEIELDDFIMKSEEIVV